MKIKKKSGLGGWGRGSLEDPVEGGVRVDVNKKLKVL